jgi:exosortase/archaeosortase family protein
MKKSWNNLFLFFAIFLMFFPFVTLFSSIMTHFFEKTNLNFFVQFVVPFEVNMVASLLSLLHIPVAIKASMLTVNGHPLQITWNCVGWQSLLLLILSFFTGFEGRYTVISKLEAAVIGIIGLFWMNMGRIVFVCILGGYFPHIFTVVYHDILATILTILYLFAFWVFSYKFTLETKNQNIVPQERRQT